MKRTQTFGKKTGSPRDEMMQPYGCLIQDPPTHVAELIDATSTTWDRQRLHEVFFPFDVSVIMGIPYAQ